MEFRAESYLVLEMMLRGARTLEDIADMLGIDVRRAAALVGELASESLVERRRRRFPAGKEVYVLTEGGRAALSRWREEVLRNVEKAAELRRQGREEEARALLRPVIHILPALLMFGVLDLALFDAAVGKLEPEVEAAQSEATADELPDETNP